MSKSGCVADFVAEHLGGKWEGLREVNPLLFYNSKMSLADCEWLKCPGRSFDCDDTDLARAVYREVWKLEFPEFRGDTMNSFRTIFGRERFTRDVCDVPRVYAGSAADRRFGIPSDLQKRIQVFWGDYHTIGNFIPLPNKRVNGKTLNTYRSGIWKDYFPPFLQAVRAYLDGEFSKSKLPVEFIQLMEANSFFWNQYRGNFAQYVRDFFLDGYLDGSGTIINLSRVYWWDKSLTEDEYIRAAKRYLDFTRHIIGDRAKRICDILRSKASREELPERVMNMVGIIPADERDSVEEYHNHLMERCS